MVKFTVKSKYFQVSKKIASKDYKKFMAVDERDRDEIFQDYIDDMLKDQQDNQHSKAKETI